MRNLSVALLVCAGLAACAAASAEVSAIDASGRRVTLAAPARRIVSLAPHATELLYAAGAGAKVVAVSDYSDFPEAAKRLPRVASSGGVDLERLLALRADLVVAWRLEATARALDRIEALGIPLAYIEPHRLEEIPQAIETLGVLAGTQEIAQAEAARLRAELGRLASAYRGRPPIDVFYEISQRPLMTLSGRHFVSDALALCGGRNVFAAAPIIAPEVDAEAVLAADPQVIISARSDPADNSWQDFWLRFSNLRAVRDGNLMAIHGEEMHRHGPRAIAATAKLCELLDEARRRSGLHSRLRSPLHSPSRAASPR
jgi:iron complex transport system substrate-binding protein